MPVDSSGNATRPPSPIPVSGQDADAPQVNVPIDDIYSVLNLLTFLDGRKSLRGNIPMNGYRAVGAANAVDDQDYVTFGQLQSLLAAEPSQVPTGIMASLSGTTIPQGWVRANGQSLSRSAYPALWAFAQTSGNLAATQEDKTAGQYGPGNGTTTFTLPNLEADGGYFIRPVTSGRGIGTVQDEALKAHLHTGIKTSVQVPVTGWGTSGNAPRPGVSIANGRMVTGSGDAENVETLESIRAAGAAQTLTLTGNADTSSTGGTETRPKNIAYPIIIKA